MAAPAATPCSAGGSDDLFGELGDEYFDCGDTGTDADIAIQGEGASEWVIDCETYIP